MVRNVLFLIATAIGAGAALGAAARPDVTAAPATRFRRQAICCDRFRPAFSARCAAVRRNRTRADRGLHDPHYWRPGCRNARPALRHYRRRGPARVCSRYRQRLFISRRRRRSPAKSFALGLNHDRIKTFGLRRRFAARRRNRYSRSAASHVRPMGRRPGRRGQVGARGR